MNWKEIRKLYDNALPCFKCPKGVKEWMRDEETGYYYLYAALREAKSMTGIDHLTYARILALMADVTYPKDYGCFVLYVKPAYEQMQLALAEGGEQPSESEASHVERMFLRGQHEAKYRDDAPEIHAEAISLIGNNELFDMHNVDFYDSRFVSFSIKDDHKATLKLDYDGKVMKISFGNVMEYEISSNASAEYVNTFYCYPEFERPAVIVITLGFLMVKALKVTLDSVSASKIEGMAGRIG